MVATMTTPATEALHSRAEDTSAGKALAILDAFAGRLGVVGVTALAERAQVTKPTAHRLLQTLVAGGYVRRVGDRYCLSEHVFEMGNQVRSCRPSGIRELAGPYLGELFAETRQTIHLAVLSEADVLYLDKVAGRDGAPCPTAVGTRRPGYATALGKALLAFSAPETLRHMTRVPFRRFTRNTLSPAQFEKCLGSIKEEGYASDHEELRSGVNCIAAPVLDPRTGHAIAAISVCTATASASAERRNLRALLRITAELSSRPSLAVG